MVISLMTCSRAACSNIVTSGRQRLVTPKVLDASTPGFDTTRACRIKEWENLYSGSQAFLNPAAEPSRALAGHEERPWQRCIRSAKPIRNTPFPGSGRWLRPSSSARKGCVYSNATSTRRDSDPTTTLISASRCRCRNPSSRRSRPSSPARKRGHVRLRVKDDLRTPVHLVGLCQGGWMSAMYACRFPDKVRSLVLAGAPIDTDAGNGPIKRMAHRLPMSVYRNLVAAGGGRMRGEVMLAGWKNMHPGEQYLTKYIDLYDHIADKGYVARSEHFERWFENALDLPGATISRRSRSCSRRIASPRVIHRLGAEIVAEGHQGPPLPAGWRDRRHYNQGAGVRGSASGRDPGFRHCHENDAWRPYRAVHGFADVGRSVAGDRPLDEEPRTRLRRNT